MKLTFGFDREPTDTDELLQQFWVRWLKLPDDLRQLLTNLFRHFMKYGTWPAIEDIAHRYHGKRLGEVRELVERSVSTGFVQREPEQNRYGACLWIGSDPTSHEVQVVNGVKVYAGCALDALWVFSFTAENGIIRSACPHCRAKLSVWFEHGEMVKSEPQGILLFLGVKLVGEGTSGDLACPFINLFPGPEHIESWRSKNPGVDGLTLTRRETEKLARVVSRQEQATIEFMERRLDNRTSRSVPIFH